MKRFGITLLAVGALGLVLGCGSSYVPLETANTTNRGEDTQVIADGTVRSVTQYVGGRPNPNKKWVLQGPTGTRYMLPSGLDSGFYTDGLPVRFKLEVLNPNMAPDGYGLSVNLIELTKL